jgi:hypothetical protein
VLSPKLIPDMLSLHFKKVLTAAFIQCFTIKIRLRQRSNGSTTLFGLLSFVPNRTHANFFFNYSLNFEFITQKTV